MREAEDINKSAPRNEEVVSSRHVPVIEKPPRTFSIKEIISDAEESSSAKTDHKNGETATETPEGGKAELNEENFANAWKGFVDSLRGEGPRIISMFKSLQPEMEDNHTIKIHLSNAAQKDLFIQNYRQKLTAFMENKFQVTDLDIETSVDLSESNEVLYTDEQKYNYLQAKYPILKDFKKAFNLDFS